MWQKGSCLALVKMHELNLTTVTTAILHSKDGVCKWGCIIFEVQGIYMDAINKFPNERLKFLPDFWIGNKTCYFLSFGGFR